MNLHVLLWCCTFVVLAVKAFQHPAWGISLYFLTVFAHPGVWWWGDALAGKRVVLLAGVILLVTAALHRGTFSGNGRFRSTASCSYGQLVGIAIIVNATMVHYLLALNPIYSFYYYSLLAKHVLLFLLTIAVVRDEKAFRIFVVTLAIGLAYFGYEVVLNGEGVMNQGRLERVGRAGFGGANSLAAMVAVLLPLSGGLLVYGRRWQKVLGGFCGAAGLEILTLCNSRGGILAALAAAAVLIVVSPSVVRRKALLWTAIGLIAAGCVVNEDVADRFLTTFATGNQRDRSAASRFIMWKAGLLMVSERPFGSGGRGFKYSEQGDRQRFVAAEEADASDPMVLSTHNGYIADACDWGVQGFLLKMLLFLIAWGTVRRTMRHQSALGQHEVVFYGSCILAAITAFLVMNITGDHSSDEMHFWIAAIAICYGNIYGPTSLEHGWLPERATHGDASWHASPVAHAGMSH